MGERLTLPRVDVMNWCERLQMGHATNSSVISPERNSVQRLHFANTIGDCQLPARSTIEAFRDLPDYNYCSGRSTLLMI